MNIRLLLLALILSTSVSMMGQSTKKQSLKEAVYQPSKKRVIDITHTRLEVKPFFKKRSLYGKAFINIKPYNRPLEEFELDAKGMKIRQVFIVNASGFIPVEHTYDDLILSVKLNKTYKLDEQFTLFIEYTAHPYALEEKGINLNSGRGMYFIDPFDVNPYKDTQLWTSGETVSNSVWFPTVDAPNEHFTQDIYITVDRKYTTLSNGILEKTTINDDGTKTDYWKQDQPHSPYLAMIAVSKFHTTLDDWGPIKLYYYTSEKYSEDVRKVFGQTPYMMSYFSNLLGVDFPWAKYAQVVVHDFNAGAMENTSASVFYEPYYADKYDVLDNNYDDIIAHELMHQWFGDLVTCESWSQLALNEAFATYGEYLWYENKYGKDEADHLHHKYLNKYLDEYLYKSDPIIKYYFEDADLDLFDAHRYEKGSRVVHMLKDYLGDDFFFEGLKYYLKLHRHRPVEIHDLRLAFEKVTGEDLNWFFDQWFLRAGHPIVDIKTSYDATSKEVTVSIDQVQPNDQGKPAYRLPISIDIYESGVASKKEVWVQQYNETFKFKVNAKPRLINVDSKKILLWEKKEEKTIKELTYQFFNASHYLDKLEALEGLKSNQNSNDARKVYQAALKDKFWGIRSYATRNINLDRYTSGDIALNQLKRIATDDVKSSVRRKALSTLANHNMQIAIPIADTLLNRDQSRMVLGAALKLLYDNNPDKYYKEASRFESIRNNYIASTLASIYGEKGGKSKHQYFKDAIWSAPARRVPSLLENYSQFLYRMDSETISSAAKFLKDIALFEENENSKMAAKNTLMELKSYFTGKSTSENSSKIQALESALNELK